MGQVGVRLIRSLFAHVHSKASQGGASLKPDSIDCGGLIECIDRVKIQDTGMNYYGNFGIGTNGRINIYPNNIEKEVFIQTANGQGILLKPMNAPSYNQVHVSIADYTTNKNAEILHIVRGSNTGRYPNDNSTVVIEKIGTSLLELIGADTNIQGIAFTNTSDGIRGQILYDHDNNFLNFSVEAQAKTHIDAQGNLQIGWTNFISDTKTGSNLIILYPGTEPISGIPYNAAIGSKIISDNAYIYFVDEAGNQYVMKIQSALTAKDTSAIDATWGAEEQAIMANNRTRIEEIENALKAIGFLPS